MNRLPQLLSSTDWVDTSAASHVGEVGSAKFSTDRDTPAALFMPLHYEPNYAYPLLVWLHGPGESEQQLKRIMPLVSMRNYVAVAPRGVTTEPVNRQGWSWPTSAGAEASLEQRVWQGITLARSRANIAKRRIFIGGFGTGGTAALRLAMRFPERFAGVLSLCGSFPQGGNPLSRLDRARRVPIFLACGQEAPRYAQDQVCQDLRLLHTAGMTVSLRVYPGGDEMICSHMLPDMDRWMMEQILGPQTAASAV